MLGYLASRHPMALYAKAIRAIRPVAAPALGRHIGELVTCVGMLTAAKPVHTIKEEPMEFVTFDDGAGLIETVIFPDVYRKVVSLLFGVGPYVMRGGWRSRTGRSPSLSPRSTGWSATPAERGRSVEHVPSLRDVGLEAHVAAVGADAPVQAGARRDLVLVIRPSEVRH